MRARSLMESTTYSLAPAVPRSLRMLSRCWPTLLNLMSDGLHTCQKAIFILHLTHRQLLAAAPPNSLSRPLRILMRTLQSTDRGKCMTLPDAGWLKSPA